MTRSITDHQVNPCNNAIALTKLEEALMELNRRTAQRIERGVEGTHQV